MKWIPKFLCGATTYTLTQPQKLWTVHSKSHGGGDVSDAGVPEAFIIRRDQLVDVEIRFLESEWAIIDTIIAFGQTGQSFTFWFDKDDNATDYVVYLDSPSIGDGDVSPTRDSYVGVYTLRMTLRTTDASRFLTAAR